MPANLRPNHIALALAAGAVFLAGSAGPALAYIGPGAGLTAFGTVLAVFAALFLAIVGFVWYPVKRMLRRRAPAGGIQESKPGSPAAKD